MNEITGLGFDDKKNRLMVDLLSEDGLKSESFSIGISRKSCCEVLDEEIQAKARDHGISYEKLKDYISRNCNIDGIDIQIL